MNKLQIIFIAGLLLLMTACSPDANKLVSKGNKTFDEQQYLAALEIYQNAQIESPELAEPYYNAANALYREGQYAEALAQMQQALLYADQQEIAQAGYYNMGNNLYNAQDLEAAIQAYKEALLINPNDQDAKYNLELALQQQQQQQEEQEQQEQDQQDQESEGGEGDQEQENQDQQDGQGDQEQDSQDGQNGEQDSEEQKDGEGQEGDQSQDQQDSQGQEGDQPQDQQGEDQGQNGQPDPSQQGNNFGQLKPGERMSSEQAEQLLAAIAGNSDTLQERLEQILVVPGPPSLQDW